MKPFLDQLPGVSDERDIDEPDADEKVVFKTPIVGGSASLLSKRKLRSHLMNKIHAWTSSWMDRAWSTSWTQT